MKAYVHKHFAFELSFWEVVESFFKENEIDNETEFVRDALMLKIQQQSC